MAIALHLDWMLILLLLRFFWWLMIENIWFNYSFMSTDNNNSFEDGSIIDITTFAQDSKTIVS
jgi:hypothetical protein